MTNGRVPIKSSKTLKAESSTDLIKKLASIR
jgi:hypothetical protein